MQSDRVTQQKMVDKHLARQSAERGMRESASGDSYEDAGPPHWDRGAWERFKAQYGYYPYGFQTDAYVMPPHFEGAPDWVYELIGQRKTPFPVGQFRG